MRHRDAEVQREKEEVFISLSLCVSVSKYERLIVLMDSVVKL